MTTLERPRTWIVPRRLLDDQIGLALLLWAGFVVVIAGIIAGIAIFDTVTGSVWEPVSPLVGWYALYIGIYLARDVLPLHVMYGQTRRECAIQGAVFIVIFAAALAVLITVGLQLERVLYAVAGWPHDLSGDHLFTSAGQIPLIFIQYWLEFLVWLAVGAFVTAAWYRFDANGLLTIALLAIPIGLTGIVLGSTSWGAVGLIVDWFGDEPASPPAALALLVYIASFLLTLAMTWPIVRDIPIRAKKS